MNPPKDMAMAVCIPAFSVFIVFNAIPDMGLNFIIFLMRILGVNTEFLSNVLTALKTASPKGLKFLMAYALFWLCALLVGYALRNKFYKMAVTGVAWLSGVGTLLAMVVAIYFTGGNAFIYYIVSCLIGFAGFFFMLTIFKMLHT